MKIIFVLTLIILTLLGGLYIVSGQTGIFPVLWKTKNQKENTKIELDTTQENFFSTHTTVRQPQFVANINSNLCLVISDKETGGNDVRYVFITRSEIRLGGMRGATKVGYAAKDGMFQSTQERSDDVVLALQEGKTDVSGTFQTLDTSALKPIPEAFEPIPPGPAAIPEVGGPTLFVEVGFCNAPTRQWVGNPDEAPPSIQELVRKVEQLTAQAPPVPLMAGARFIRTQILPPHRAEFIGGIIVVTPDQLERNETLGQAIIHARRLISVPTEESLYSSLPLAFRHGVSAHISHEQKVYQLRHLIVAQ